MKVSILGMTNGSSRMPNNTEALKLKWCKITSVFDKESSSVQYWERISPISLFDLNILTHDLPTNLPDLRSSWPLEWCYLFTPSLSASDRVCFHLPSQLPSPDFHLYYWSACITSKAPQALSETPRLKDIYVQIKICSTKWLHEYVRLYS